MKRVLSTLFAVCILTLGTRGETMAQDFKNFAIGAINLVALTDFPKAPAATPPHTELLVGLSAEALAKVTGADMVNAVNMFVLKTAQGNYLFDTGVGGQGGMIGSMAAAGLTPADISAVVITHFHGDHIGGLTKDGAAVFPNAKLYVPREEMEKGPYSARFAAAYADRTVQFTWDEEILPGVKALKAIGHTQGHTVYMIESAGDKLLIAGDLIHFGGVQLPNPDIAVTYDTDTAQAIASRKQFFNMAADQTIPIASMHLPFPAVGKLAKADTGYTFTPLP
jgi:glyoxylase-like metal-dependent hydrolase (beta-lactamase superfamily II)